MTIRNLIPCRLRSPIAVAVGALLLAGAIGIAHGADQPPRAPETGASLLATARFFIRLGGQYRPVSG